MADPGRRSFSSSSSSLLWFAAAPGHTLPEHHTCLALLQQLDRAWFHDNLLKPRVGLFDAFLPYSDPASLPSPYQSIELVDADTYVRRSGSSPVPQASHLSIPRRWDMPRTKFQALPHPNPPNLPRHLPHTDINSPRTDRAHHPQASVTDSVVPRPLIPQRHVYSNPLADTVLCPPAAVHKWSVRNLQGVKDLQMNGFSRVPELDSAQFGKPSAGISHRDMQPPHPAFKVLGTRKGHGAKNSKSLTALEFNEIQGLMDLGFQFSQDDLTPRIVTMFPALKHKLGEGGNAGRSPRGAHNKPRQRSWFVQGSSVPLRNRQVPATNEDIKEHLKFWARAVASTVRQEC